VNLKFKLLFLLTLEIGDRSSENNALVEGIHSCSFSGGGARMIPDPEFIEEK